MNETLTTIQQRRSIRKYQDRQIPLADCEQIVQAGLYAPSSMNTQSWHLLVLRDRKAIDALTRELKEATARMPGNPYKAFVGSPSYTVNYGAPTVIVCSCDPSSTSSPEADAALALGNMMLAARSLGIGSCWINQLNHVSDEPGFRSFITDLGLSKTHLIYGSCALGYPAGDFPEAPARKGLVTWLKDAGE